MKRATWLAAAIALLALFAASAVPLRAALRVEVLRGEGSYNNAVQGTAISPAVRVLDENGTPLAGALVVFSPPWKGSSVAFAGFDLDADTLTDESGVAIAPHVRPIGANGPLEIRVMASHVGELANCIVHQINIGVEGETERERELNVVALPREVQPGNRAVRGFSLAVRVEDGRGTPAPHAMVLFVLCKLSNGGKLEEISRIRVTAGPNGEALGTWAKQSGHGHLEFIVQAELGGRRATRYFPID